MQSKKSPVIPSVCVMSSDICRRQLFGMSTTSVRLSGHILGRHPHLGKKCGRNYRVGSWMQDEGKERRGGGGRNQ